MSQQAERQRQREQLREKVDLVALIGQYVELQRKGRDWFGLCPFHAERTPSFSVSPAKQMFYCFGCGVGGDALHFLMEIEGLAWAEAWERLDGMIPSTGTPTPAPVVAPQAMPATLATAPEPIVEIPPEELRQALQFVAQFYHRCLLATSAGEAARRYVVERKLTAETVATFQLGFAPEQAQLTAFFRKRDLSLAPLYAAGILSPQGQERFAGRLIVPIHDARGRVVGLGGRILSSAGKQAKYINSAGSSLFQKGDHLFNLHRARSEMRTAQEVVLLEGYMDVLTAWQAGVRQAVGTLGTALSDAQAAQLRRLQRRVVIAYDADKAGREAALRSAQKLEKVGSDVGVAVLPPGSDPDELVRQQGPQALLAALAEAHEVIAFQLEVLQQSFQDLTQPAERHRYVRRALEILAHASPVACEHYLKRLAEQQAVSLSSLQAELQLVRRQAGSVPVRSPQVRAKPGSINRIEASERTLLAAMLPRRTVTHWVQAHLGDGFPTHVYAALAARLYTYYAQEGQVEDPQAFIETLHPEPLLRKIATQLVQLRVPLDAEGRVLQDCLFHLRSYPLAHAVKESEAGLHQAGLDAEQALQRLVRTIELRRCMAQWHQASGVRTHAKEAMEVGKRTE